MSDAAFTVIANGVSREVVAAVDGDSVRLAPDALEAALGWTLKPQGLCQGDVCVPLRDPGAVDAEGRIDLGAVATVLDRPLAMDAAEAVAAFGTSARVRTAQLQSLEAPDFTLPDLSGTPHSLSDHRGKKVLLIAYASW